MPPPPPNQPPAGNVPGQGTTLGQGSIPGLTPQQLVAQQAAARTQANTQNAQDQAKLQKEAEQAEKNIFRRIYNKTIKRGSLIVFQYTSHQHDPSPLVLVGKLWGADRPGMISGLNLHYLTFRYIKQLVQFYCGKDFHYGLIRGNQYIVNAYRSYKREGRRQVKTLDCEYLMNVLGVARSFKPTELEAIRRSVQDQLRAKMHPTAADVAKQYQQSIHTQSHKNYNIGKSQPDGRTAPFGLNQPTPPQGP